MNVGKKKYLIISPNITYIGGAQIYIRNKKIFMEENGWEVYVFSAKYGNVIIGELKESIDCVFPQLNIVPIYLPNATKNRIIDLIIKHINFFDAEIIIETHSIATSMWGEIIAGKVEGKHIVYLLSEYFEKTEKYQLAFLDFKHRRRELAGISNKSLGILFSRYKKLVPDENYALNAVCLNCVENIKCPIIDNLGKMDVNIACITRLEKPYVNSLANEIVVFANKNSGISVQVIFLGGTSEDGVEKRLRMILSRAPNVNLVVTGYISPIPLKIFEIADLFIGVSDAAKISAIEGSLTLTIDVINYRPIGLLGIDTHDSIYCDSSRKETIAEILHDILIINKLHLFHKKKMIAVKKMDFREEYFNHIEFISLSSREKSYYNISNHALPRKEAIKKMLYNILGVAGYNRLARIKRSIIKS